MGIVVGYLATTEGRAALAAAIQEAGRRQTGVVVVISARPGEPEADRAIIEADLELVRAQLAESGIEHEIRLVESGDVADDLIVTAEQVDAQLIVLGLRRRSPVGKLILGANAQRVLFDAGCPVLTVKPGPL